MQDREQTTTTRLPQDLNTHKLVQEREPVARTERHQKRFPQDWGLRPQPLPHNAPLLSSLLTCLSHVLHKLDRMAISMFQELEERFETHAMCGAEPSEH